MTVVLESSMRVDGAVAQLTNAIVGGLHALVLTLDQPTRLLVEITFIERLAIILNGGVLSSFAFGQNRMRLMRCESSLQIHPATMQGARDTAALVGIAAERAHPLLEFADELGALDGVIVKHAGE